MVHLSGARPSRAARLDLHRVAHHREQPARQVLPPHGGRPARARPGARLLASVRQRRRARSRRGELSVWSDIRAGASRLLEVFRRRSRVAAEQHEEFAFHIEMETAENVRRGMTPAEARRAALLRFGGTQRFREATSDARGLVALDNLARDARFALRRLKRARGFSAGVIATLGVGLGTAIGIGTIVYDVLLRDLPYDHPDQLVRVGFVTEGNATTGDLNTPATYFH